MHLLFQGVMKTLMESWIFRKSQARLKLSQVKRLRMKFLSIRGYVPFEFQRKTFDSYDLARWKATEYRFVLLYCGPAILKDILSKQLYDHFLLLFVACRILHCKNLMITYSDYARQLLRNFFFFITFFIW